MPKKQNPISPAEQRKRFEDEVRRLKEAGDFDQSAADKALETLVRKRVEKGS